MNLWASWYPVLIVDDGFFSPPSLAFVLGTSALAGDARARARGAGCCTDNEEPEPEALFLFDRCFFFLGVVTTAEKNNLSEISQCSESAVTMEDSAAPSADTDTDTDAERACTGPGPPGREELEEEEVGEEEAEDEEGERGAAAPAFFAAFFRLVVEAAGPGARASTLGCESVSPGGSGMETPTLTPLVPAAPA